MIWVPFAFTLFCLVLGLSVATAKRVPWWQFICSFLIAVWITAGIWLGLK